MNRGFGIVAAVALIIIGVGGWWYFNQTDTAPSEAEKAAIELKARANTGTKPPQKLFGEQTPSDPQGVIHSTGVILQPNGLLVLNFGASPETVIPRLSSMVGSPSKDTGWIGSFSTYGTCPGEKIRVVEWNRLRAFFGDTTFGAQKFFQWEYTRASTGVPGPVLATEKGVTLGMTKAEVLALYPQAQISPWMDNLESMRLIADNSATNAHLGGTLEGGTLEYLSGGIQCGE